MIKDPQIIIVYEPGMFGTTVCNVFAEHEQYRDKDKIKKKFIHEDAPLDAHATGYKDILDKFHNIKEFYQDFLKIQDYRKFFKPLKDKGLSIHRLAGWIWLTVDYKKYFSNFVIGLLVPDESEIDVWAERYFESMPNFQYEYWVNNVKDMSKLPYWFKRAMSIKERKKLLTKNLKFIKQNKQLNQTIQINPKILFNNDTFQQFVDECCEKINISTIKIPRNKLTEHFELNRKKIGFDKILK